MAGSGSARFRAPLKVRSPACVSRSRTTSAWPASRCSTAARCSRASSRARMRRSSLDCSTRVRKSSARPPSRRSASTGARSPAIRRPSRENPYNPARLPGASSSGSAVVVALGEADMALGGDQGGSIRMPASWSGIVGHKPTWGLVPYTGAFPIELTLDHLGPMCRSVRDCARMLEVIAGPDGLDPRQGGAEVQPYAAGTRPRRRAPARGHPHRGLRLAGRLRARRRRGGPRRRADLRGRLAPRSARSRSRSTATASRSGPRSPPRARPS